jgi:hypothetical protein
LRSNTSGQRLDCDDDEVAEMKIRELKRIFDYKSSRVNIEEGSHGICVTDNGNSTTRIPHIDKLVGDQRVGPENDTKHRRRNFLENLKLIWSLEWVA